MTPQIIQEAFHYDPLTGNVIWRLDRPQEHFKTQRSYQRYLNVQAGKPIKASVNYYGYKVVGLGQAVLAVHRIAFAIMTGNFPKFNVDHIDGNPLNNIWANLREVSQAINTRNQRMNIRNTSGYAGVYYAKRENRWACQVKVDGVLKRLGAFDTPEEAYQCRLAFLSTRPDLGYTQRHGTTS